MRKTILINIIAIATALCLGGCDISDLLDFGNKSENNVTNADNAVTMDGVIQEDAPVIVINDGDKPYYTEADLVEDEQEEGTTEVIQEEVVPQYEEIFNPETGESSVMTADPNQITMSFVGDMGFAEGYATINRYRQQSDGIYGCMDEEVIAIMQGSDIMMANNEFPYSYRGSPTPNKTYTFRADPKDVKIMNDLGVDIVSLANNHMYDYGPDALLDTLDTLDGAKVARVGAGANIDGAKRPAYIHANGKIIAFVSATQIERYANPDTKEATADSPGVLRTLNPDMTVSVIEEAAANSDFVVMYVHWGSESTDLVEQSQRDLAKAYAAAGADLIIGDHSHCLQGIDYVDGVPVFYSLGNFWFNSRTLDTCIVRATLDNDCNISKLEFIPCIQTGCSVKIGNGDNFDRILEYMRGISNYAEIDEYGCVTRSDTDHNIQHGQNTSPAKKVEAPKEVTPEAIDPALIPMIDPSLLPAPQEEVPQ